MRSRSEIKQIQVHEVKETKEYKMFELEMDAAIRWPSPLRVYLGAGAMIVACLMMIEATFLDEVSLWYSTQTIGAWVCFFCAFYLFNRQDKLNKQANVRLRDIISKDLEEMQDLAANVKPRVAEAVAEAVVDIAYLAATEQPPESENLN